MIRREYLQQGRAFLSGVAALGCCAGGAEQVVRYLRENGAFGLRLSGALCLLVAALVFGWTAWSAWRSGPEAQPPWKTLRWWRWLVAGVLAIFVVLGFSFVDQDQARFLCRGACVLWIALLLSGPAWSSSLHGTLDRAIGGRCFRGLDFAVGNVIVIVLILEVGLRGLAVVRGEDTLMLNKAMGYRLQPGPNPHGVFGNSLGFPDQEFVQAKKTGTRRIAALGDSFSVGVCVPYEDNYLTLLEALLPQTEVYNFGVSSTGPREYRVLLAQEGWKYQPDMVLVPLFLGNDILEPIAVPELLRFNPDALYVELLARRGYRLLREYGRRPGAGKLYGPLSDEGYLELASRHLSICRKVDSPTEQQRWAFALEQLRGLFADCRAHRVPVRVLLLPDEVQISKDLQARALKVRGWQAGDIDASLPNRRLLQFCANEQVPCLDLLPVFEQAGPAAYEPNDSHWNKLGNRLAAEAVAEWLLKPGAD